MMNVRVSRSAVSNHGNDWDVIMERSADLKMLILVPRERGLWIERDCYNKNSAIFLDLSVRRHATPITRPSRESAYIIGSLPARV